MYHQAWMELAEKTYAGHAWERHAQSGAGKRPDRVFRRSFRHALRLPSRPRQE